MEMMIFTDKTQQSTLPDDVIMEEIVPRVSRCNHPTLSLVSKQFRSLVASPELYARRSFLGCTKPCVYVLITYSKVCYAFWYSLNQITKRNKVENRLVPILSLPSMPIAGNYFVVGSKIFVMGGYYGYHDGPPKTPTVLCIDCRTHTARRVPDMPFVVTMPTSKVIDEKIYLVGRPVGDESLIWSPKIVMVFDTRTETWEPQTRSISEADPRWFISLSRAGKSNRNPYRIFLDYRPSISKEVKLWTDEMRMNYMLYYKCNNECVMDDVVYEYDETRHSLRTYDLKQRIWGVVKGMEKLPLGGYPAHLVSCDKKLILFFVIRDVEEKKKFGVRRLQWKNVKEERFGERLSVAIFCLMGLFAFVNV